MKWEYKVVAGSGGESDERMLNSMGERGYELVGIVVHAYLMHFYFKKPKKD